MLTLIPSTFVLETVTENDVVLASLVWGFTLGFGFLTTWTAIKQTMIMYKRRGAAKLVNPYLIMLWCEIFTCLSFSIICWMYLRGFIAPSFAFYFCILTTWALQVQFLLQIIINRISVLMIDRDKAMQLKIGVAVLITCIEISVYCIWVPARLQISDAFVRINVIWDRCEKVVYLVVDACLNYYFIRTVQRSLVKPGLNKYKPVVRFNIFMIFFSLSMDVLIISMMSLKNSFVYMQFHPLAYIVKLKIEMSMADLITSIAKTAEKNNDLDNVYIYDKNSCSEPLSPGTARSTQGSILFNKMNGTTITALTQQSALSSPTTGGFDGGSNSSIMGHDSPKTGIRNLHRNADSLADMELEDMIHGRLKGTLSPPVTSLDEKCSPSNSNRADNGFIHRQDDLHTQIESFHSGAAAQGCFAEQQAVRKPTGDSDCDQRPLRNDGGGMGLRTRV